MEKENQAAGPPTMKEMRGSSSHAESPGVAAVVPRPAWLPPPYPVGTGSRRPPSQEAQTSHGLVSLAPSEFLLFQHMGSHPRTRNGERVKPE